MNATTVTISEATLSKARAANLMIHLAGLGFRLRIRDNQLWISPKVNRLTDALRRAIKENEKAIRALLPTEPPKPSANDAYVCEVCDLPRPGQHSCPKCQLEREWLEKKRLLALGVDLAPGNMRADVQRLVGSDGGINWF